MLLNRSLPVGKIKYIRAAALLMTALITFGCSSGPKPNVSAAELLSPENSYPQNEYRIQPGDLLDIKFFSNSLLNDKIPVRPDGRVSLQLVHELMAAGLTPSQLANELTKKYAGHIKEENITVIVRSFSSLKVYVNGEVQNPKTVELKGVMTAFQAISDAGGFRDTAFMNQVIVIRQKAGQKPLAIQLDLEKVIDGTDTAQDICLIPMDIIYVPKSTIAKVDLWVDQYIRQVLPFNASFSADYHFNKGY